MEGGVVEGEEIWGITLDWCFGLICIFCWFWCICLLTLRQGPGPITRELQVKYLLIVITIYLIFENLLSKMMTIGATTITDGDNGEGQHRRTFNISRQWLSNVLAWNLFVRLCVLNILLLWWCIVWRLCTARPLDWALWQKLAIKKETIKFTRQEEGLSTSCSSARWTCFVLRHV